VVEAQHQVSTRKLVDSAAEQALLEELIDNAKPRDVTANAVHYLLSTPFRYPPLRSGSRFGTRRERGIWYGSEALVTAFAEVAYYRLVFLEGTKADLEPLTSQLTAFTVAARSTRAVDLVSPPFDRHRRTIASPTKYAESQALGMAMRSAGVELFRYPSARDTARGVNVVGLRRAGVAPADRRVLRDAFGILYRSGLAPHRAVERIRAELPATEPIKVLLDFIAASKRGICGGAADADAVDTEVEA